MQTYKSATFLLHCHHLEANKEIKHITILAWNNLFITFGVECKCNNAQCNSGVLNLEVIKSINSNELLENLILVIN